jgi:putative two-component system response regulator
MKILVVDDDSVSVEILATTLREDGHEVLSARDGLEAVRVLEQDSVRIVITDWMMPNMDGLDLCRRIRSLSPSHYVYVIMLTAKDKTQDVIRGLSAGADEFLTKPVDPVELKIRVRTGERILSVESRHVAIFGMAKLAESRDPETGEHLERMRDYVRIIAQHLVGDATLGEKITPDFIETLYLTSPLHDIGKVGIPDCILLKPGRLDDGEFQIMKTHTLIGGQTLDLTVRNYPGMPFLVMARDIALTHHERYDGKGYPHGMAGQGIPLCGRIACVADVYDALTSKRVYKTALTHEIARNIIEGERGKHFDPAVVDAFIAVQGQLQAVRRRYPGTVSDSAALPFTRGAAPGAVVDPRT